MRKIFVVCVAAGLIALSSCHHSSTSQTNLTIKFNPLFGPNVMHTYTTYSAPDGKYYNFQDFKVYLSHIKLIYTTGDSVEVEPIAYFSVDQSGFQSIAINAPSGSFKGIRFNIGLDSAQNASLPSVDTTSPLAANNNTYWGLQNQFVFVEMDGTGDTMSNSSHLFAYHIGTNSYYTAAPPLYENFSITAGGQTALTLTANVQNLFYGSNAINILTSPVTMTTDSPALAHNYISDFTQIFSLQ